MELGGLDIDNDGTTSPLCQAAARSDIELVRFFVEQGAKLTGALHAACGCCLSYANIPEGLSVIAYLLEQGADKDGYHGGCTPLFHAIKSNRHEDNALVIINYLILQEADRHKLSGSTGLTLVHAATSRRCHRPPSLPILKYLFEQGLDPNKVCNNRVSPLQGALQCMSDEEEDFLDIVRFFFEHGAVINQDDDSSLIRACGKRHFEICRLLVEHGADVNQVLNLHVVRFTTMT